MSLPRAPRWIRQISEAVIVIIVWSANWRLGALIAGLYLVENYDDIRQWLTR